MAAEPTRNALMNASAGGEQDLTQIKGIGPVRKQWLKETFSIRTYEDLAALSPKEIESKLQAEGRITSRSDIEKWLAQARELAATAEQPVASEESLSESGMSQELNPSYKTQVWRPIASFVVEFQKRTIVEQQAEYRTMVHHSETDTDAPGWPGLESNQLCKWMIEQMSDELKSGSPKRDVPATPAAPVTSSQLIVSQIQVFQPQNTLAPAAIANANQPLQGTIKRSVPFALDATFRLPEPLIVHSEQQITYSAQFSAITRPGHSALHLGETEPVSLVTGQSIYSARLPDIILQPGTYALRVIVLLKGTVMSVSFLEIPLLQVI